MRSIHDPQFPGLADALDIGGMLERLRSALSAGSDGRRLLDAMVLDIRHRPGGPCWVLYRLKLRAGGRGSVRQLVSGQVLRPGDPVDPVPQHLVARYREEPTEGLETPVVHLRDIPMVLYAYPIDASLPTLVDANSPAVVERHLGRLWTPRKVRVRRVRVDSLAYIPHSRASFLYEVLSEDRTGAPELRRLIAKMHATKPAARVFSDAWALWKAADGRVSLAPPVGYVDALGLTLQEQVRGHRLGGLVTAGEFRKWVRRTARMLAEMHGVSVPLSSRRKPSDEAEVIHRWAGALMTIRPDLAARVERLRDRLASEVEARARLCAPIHADFHHTNVLVDGGDVTIIDLDEMAFGDPMVDVGRFLASLRVPARRAFGDISALEDVREDFLSEYLQCAGGDAGRARLFEAAALLTSAGLSFRIQRASWKEEASELLDEAERVFARANAGLTLAGTGDIRAPALSAQARSHWATDGVYMQAALAPSIRKRYGAALTEVRAAASRVGAGPKRFRYELRGWKDAEPWRLQIEGVVRKSAGRGSLRRLEAVRAALDGAHNPLLLPLPIAFIDPLALLVCESPRGTRFRSVVGTDEALRLARKLAAAIAELHQTAVDLYLAPRTIDDEIASLHSHVDALRHDHPSLGERAREIVAAVTASKHRVPATIAPVLRTVHPDHVLGVDGRPGLQRAPDVTLAHPFVDPADFLGRLTMMDATATDPNGWRAAADSFRDAYRAAVGDCAGLEVFEAAALVRIAGQHLRRAGAPAVLERLVSEAEVKVAS